MKRKIGILLSFILVFICACALADVNIDEKTFPDPVFRSYVCENCDENGDGVLSDSEIAEITYIHIDDMGISSLQGVKCFTYLQKLICYDNQLTSLDLSGCSALTSLICDNNQLTSLDLSGCSALTSLICDNNKLMALDVSNNMALTDLSCESNQLTSLDVSKNTALTALYCCCNRLTSLDTGKNMVLAELFCSSNQLTSLDVSGCTSLTRLDIEDNGMESLNARKCTSLIKLYCGSGNNLIEINASECTSLTEVRCSNNKLKDLNVYGCTALTSLVCDNNQLTSLDIYECTALTSIICDKNQLKYLDVSNCSMLKELNCSSNKLNSLDLSKNTELESLHCKWNKLRVLDLSQNRKMKDVHCSSNRLTELDLSKNKALHYLSCQSNQIAKLDVRPCWALNRLVQRTEKIETDVYYRWEISETTKLYISKTVKLITQPFSDKSDIDISEKNFPDDVFRTFVSVFLDQDKDGKLCNEEIEDVDMIDISNYEIAADDEHYKVNDLTGIEFFKGLKILNCEHCEIGLDDSIIDLSSNAQLEEMRCNDNNIEALIVSNNKKLKVLVCCFIKLKELNLTGCPILVELVSTSERFEDENGLYYYWSNPQTGAYLAVGKDTKLNYD